jgi:hypothetical protein
MVSKKLIKTVKTVKKAKPAAKAVRAPPKKVAAPPVKKAVVAPKKIPKIVELQPIEVMKTNHPRIQTAEGWKRAQLKR